MSRRWHRDGCRARHTPIPFEPWACGVPEMEKTAVNFVQFGGSLVVCPAPASKLNEVNSHLFISEHRMASTGSRPYLTEITVSLTLSIDGMRSLCSMC